MLFRQLMMILNMSTVISSPYEQYLFSQPTDPKCWIHDNILLPLPINSLQQVLCGFQCSHYISVCIVSLA